jgi:hypothetical protein
MVTAKNSGADRPSPGGLKPPLWMYLVSSTGSFLQVLDKNLYKEKP